MNWQEERDATLCEARCVVVKVGSAVLSTGSELNLPVLDNLVNQLAVLSRQGRRVVLVSSGAVAAGRTALKKLPGEPAAVGLSGKQAAAAVGQGRLMYDNAFAERGILTAQVLLTRDDLKNRTRFLNIRNTFSELLNWGVIPVVNENDTVSVNELKFSDNDNLASLLINPVEADLFVNLTTIGGVPCLTFSAKALTPEALALLGTHSTRLMLFECVDGGLLRPLDWERTAYLPDDLSEILKYKGKTSAAFTHMMMNCARAASDFALAEQPLTVLDPMCGKCTTGFVALQNGMNAVCLDIDRKDLKEAADYFSNYLQFHRLKHRLAQSSRTLQKTAVPIAEYTFSDTKEHFAADDVRTLMLAEGDSGLVGDLLKKRPADLLVCDLPYGVQHAPQNGKKAESFPKLLERILPAWRRALKPGGAAAISFNTLTLRKDTLLTLLQNAGFTPLTEPPYDDFSHFVEQAVHRDFIVARNEQP